MLLYLVKCVDLFHNTPKIVGFLMDLIKSATMCVTFPDPFDTAVSYGHFRSHKPITNLCFCIIAITELKKGEAHITVELVNCILLF